MFLVFNVFFCTALNQTQYACARFADHVVRSVAIASGGASDGNNPSGSTSTPDSGEQLQSVLAKAGLLHLLPRFVREKMSFSLVYRLLNLRWDLCCK